MINDYDLFCVTETKLDSHDIVTLQGYTFISQPRRQNVLRRSGGIGFFVKDSIAHHISVIDSESDYILWIKLSKSFCNTEDDLIFGIVYLPPTDSRFNNPEELDLFEIEITSMSISHKYIFLLGDFNARTQSEKEFLDGDDFFADHFGYDDTLNQFYNISSLLTQYNFDYNRSSEDKLLNKEGKFLLDICKSNNLFFMNGRCGQDKGRGKLTFKEISVIDYSIVSAHALKFVHDFDINKLDCLFSDGHSLLSTHLKLNISQVMKPNKTANKKKPPPRWHEEKKADFLLHIDRNKIMAINNYICELHQNKNVNKNDINQICNDIGSIFAMAAETISQQTNSSSYKHNAENLNASKPWFGYKCQNARRKYHIARKINNINPSNRNKANLKEASKNYKKSNEFPY